MSLAPTADTDRTEELLKDIKSQNALRKEGKLRIDPPKPCYIFGWLCSGTETHSLFRREGGEQSKGQAVVKRCLLASAPPASQIPPAWQRLRASRRIIGTGRL